MKKPIVYIAGLILSSVLFASSICSKVSYEKDKKLVAHIRGKYKEVTLQQIKSLKLNRFHTPDFSLTLLAPMEWRNISDKGDAILYLLRKGEKSVGKFALRSLESLQNSLQEKSLNEIIKKAAKLIGEISMEDASKNGDVSKQVSPVKFFNFNNKHIGHFVMRRTGKTKNRWESWTLIWDVKKLYLLLVTSRENELEVGEFHSLLGAESLCSEGK